LKLFVNTFFKYNFFFIDETEEETKELSYKIFDFFYLPEITEELKLNNFKDIIDEIISSIKTK
jgi:hypothetical protein